MRKNRHTIYCVVERAVYKTNSTAAAFAFPKKWLCLVVMLLVGNALFAGSPRRESFAIRNSSSSDVIINMEFWYGPGRNLNDQDFASGLNPGFVLAEGFWTQTISGITLSIQDWLAILETNIIRPGQNDVIIRYHAPGPPELFDKMVSIPFMDKMNAIFKTLEIIHNDGRGLITLNDLGAIPLEKSVFAGGVTYWLEIFDFDVVLEYEAQRVQIRADINLRMPITP